MLGIPIIRTTVLLGFCRDNGRENGNYCSILRLYRDNGKENGNYYIEVSLFWEMTRVCAGVRSSPDEKIPKP